MFNSTGNNFGAGVIQFKDVQESNYIVLNAKFTCSPQSAEYQAAEVLEIKVPKLSISRSTIAGVVARYKKRGDSLRIYQHIRRRHGAQVLGERCQYAVY